MKKIVPFKKDITFDSNIAEISSISLEHTLKLKEENLVSGEFIISGTYKMTEASLNSDSFEYQLPFDISIDKKYDTSEVSVDISDFYYEVTDSKILSISIEVVLEGLKEREDILPEETLKPVREEIETLETETSQVKSIFEDLDENERYVVYKVHVVTENDTIDNIVQTYQVTKENLEAYNDLSDLKIGDKLIIPSHED